jgi:undecaprenyl-diphosphatase
MSQSELLPGTARRRAAALLAGCCAAVLIVLGVVLANGTTADPLDGAIDGTVIGWFDGHAGVPAWLAVPASTAPDWALTVIIVIACLLARRFNGALLGATAVPVTALLCDSVFEPLFHRTYMGSGSLSYPSGHTASMFALATTLTILLFPRRVLIPGLAFITALTVAIGVIGARWHYFTDTIGGAVLGTGTVCALALLLDLPAVRRFAGPAARNVTAFPMAGSAGRTSWLLP